MLNECLAALQVKLEELNLPVLGSEVVIAMDRDVRVPIELDLGPNQLPAVVMNYQGDGNIDRSGSNKYKYFFRGSVLICVYNFRLKKATEELNELTFGKSGVYKKLMEIPAPTIEGQPLRRNITGARPRNFTGKEDKDFYLMEEILCDLEIWL